MAFNGADAGMSDGKMRLAGQWKSDAIKNYINPVNFL